MGKLEEMKEFVCSRKAQGYTWLIGFKMVPHIQISI